MRKGTLSCALVMLLALLLGGCSAGGELPMQKALTFRAALQGAGGCGFLGEVTADFGESVYTFTLACDTDEAGTLQFTVTAPESISGITGEISGSTGKLTFDGTVLAFDSMAGGQVSPVTAAYTAAQSWRTGYIRSCGREQGRLTMAVETSFENDPLIVETWLDEEKGVPFFSEICYNGKRLLSVSITDFQYNSKAE